MQVNMHIDSHIHIHPALVVTQVAHPRRPK